MHGIEVDIHGRNKIAARYLRQIEEEAFTIIREFVDLLSEFRHYFNADLVGGDLLLKLHRSIKVTSFCRQEFVLPGIMDTQIEQIVCDTFKKLGKPVPKNSAENNLKSLVLACRKERIKKQIKHCELARKAISLKNLTS